MTLTEIRHLIDDYHSTQLLMSTFNLFSLMQMYIAITSFFFVSLMSFLNALK